MYVYIIVKISFWQVFGNFLTFKWQFSGGSDVVLITYHEFIKFCQISALMSQIVRKTYFKSVPFSGNLAQLVTKCDIRELIMEITPFSW